MVTDKNFTEGINNLSKEFDKLNPPKKLWYKITSKKSEFQKRMEQPIQKIIDATIPHFIGYHGETISFFENYLGLKIKIKEEKWGINSTINSLSYSRCTNDIEDLL